MDASTTIPSALKSVVKNFIFQRFLNDLAFQARSRYFMLIGSSTTTKLFTVEETMEAMHKAGSVVFQGPTS